MTDTLYLKVLYGVRSMRITASSSLHAVIEALEHRRLRHDSRGQIAGTARHMARNATQSVGMLGDVSALSPHLRHDAAQCSHSSK